MMLVIKFCYLAVVTDSHTLRIGPRQYSDIFSDCEKCFRYPYCHTYEPPVGKAGQWS